VIWGRLPNGYSLDPLPLNKVSAFEEGPVCPLLRGQECRDFSMPSATAATLSDD